MHWLCVPAPRSATGLLFSLASLVETSIFEAAASDLVLQVEDAAYVPPSPPLSQRTAVTAVHVNAMLEEGLGYWVARSCIAVLEEDCL